MKINMVVELLTKEDLKNFKEELMNELRNFERPKAEVKLLKSIEVKSLLGCSDGTLQKHRLSGRLPATKLGGTYYYKNIDLERLLNN